MEFATLTLSVFDPFYAAFGWVMGVLYDLVNNYGLVIILFTILIRGIVLLPLNIRSQRSMMKQQAVAPLVQDLKRRYGDDKQRIQQEQMKIYKEYDIKMSAGCLPMILQLLIIIPVYRSIQAPLRYIMQVSTDNIEAIGNYLSQAGLLESTRNLATNNIPIITALQNNAQALAHVVNEGLMKLSDLVDMSFLGLNLGINPSISPAKLFGDEMPTYLPLLLIPILAVVTTFLQTKVTEWTNPIQRRRKQEQALAKKNPARQQPNNDPSASMTSTMKYFMPIMIAFFTFSMPAAIGLYWVVGNILAIMQSFLISGIMYGFPKQQKKLSETPDNLEVVTKS